MDWRNLEADVNYWHNNYSSGRDGYSLNRIVVHHNAGPHLSHDAVGSAFNSRGTSAHYNVDYYGSVCQYVHDYDTAYHAGNWAVNCQSIGIEHANSTGAEGGWDIDDDTLDAGAHLTAALCVAYGLGVPQWRVNVFPHSDFFSTACPASLRDKYANDYIAKAQQYYNNLDADLSKREGWVSQDGGWWYRNADGSWRTGWFQDNDRWFYANDKGWIQVGWQRIGEYWYFFHNVHDTNYGSMQVGWVKDGEYWFYLSDDGKMLTGWVQVKDKWYFFETNGVMRTGWLSYEGNDYFLTSTGAMATGVAQTRMDGSCSAFDENGRLLIGRLVIDQDAEGILKLVSFEKK